MFTGRPMQTELIIRKGTGAAGQQQATQYTMLWRLDKPVVRATQR